MENLGNFGEMQFNLPKNQSNVIKVIGVGGGGSNAVNHMYNLGVTGVDFVICNTDAQALNSSSVPIKIQLGATLTEGLGAGGDPEIGRQSAIESRDAITAMLGEKTKMVFITAGMGGGTGTGAAPIIAAIAREMGFLTVAIVTIPFTFEGKIKKKQAQEGIEDIKNYVDSIIVINNNKLREVYGNLGITSGYSKVDEVLSTAAMGISKVITNHYSQNIDFRDANTVLANSGTAIMGSAKAEGVNRAQEAITKALDSPLLNDNKIEGAKNVLLLLAYGDNEITIDEMGEINDYIQSEAKTNVNIFMGVGPEEGLGDYIEVTVVATGFNKELQHKISTIENEKVIYNLEDSIESVTKKTVSETPKTEKKQEPIIVHQLFEEDEHIDKAQSVEMQIVEETPQEPLTLFDLEEHSDKISVKKTSAENVEEPKNEVKNNTSQNFLGDGFFELLSEIKKEFPDDTTTVSKAPVNDTPEIEEFVINNAINEVPEIKETKVDKKEVEFIITPVVSEIEVFDVEQVLPLEDNQMTLPFDLPIDSKKQVNQEQVANKEQDETVIKRHSLEDYNTLEDILSNAKPQDYSTEDTIEEDEPILKLEKKIVIENDMEVEDDTDISPLNGTIKQLKMRSDERRIKMKRYNYKFEKNVQQSIEDLEKQPAYKRQNVELNENPTSNDITRTSLEINEDGVTFRSNNSFLHDNVD